MIIELEGIDGCGKSTQARLLHDALVDQGRKCIISSPFLTDYGRQLRNFYLQDMKTTPLTQVFLLASGVCQLATDVLKDNSVEQIIILDRYIYSTYVYHGDALGVGAEIIEKIYSQAIQGCWPDLVFLLDISPEQAIQRRIGQQDRVERMPLEYHRRVREGYLKLAKMKKNFCIIDASRTPQVIHSAVMDVLQERKIP